MQQNKLLNKYILPERIAFGGFVGLSCISAILLGKIVKLGNEIEKDYQEKVILNPFTKKQELDAINPFLCAVLILMSGVMAFVCMDIVRDKKKQADAICKKYLKSWLKTASEQSDEQTKGQIVDAIRKCDEIFKNQQALGAVIATICNSLTPQEQNKIISIAKEFNHSNEKNTLIGKKEAAKTRNEILQIIKEHSRANPDFLSTMVDSLKNAHKTYVLPTQQITR